MDLTACPLNLKLLNTTTLRAPSHTHTRTERPGEISRIPKPYTLSRTVLQAPAPRFRLPWQRPKPTELRKNELKAQVIITVTTWVLPPPSNSWIIPTSSPIIDCYCMGAVPKLLRLLLVGVWVKEFAAFSQDRGYRWLCTGFFVVLILK